MLVNNKHNRSRNNRTTIAMLPLIWVLVLVGIQKQQVLMMAAASGVFEINFASLQDAHGRDLRQDYDCCQWQNDTVNNLGEQQDSCDPTKCQLIIRICVKNYQTMLESSQCTFGELTGQVMRPNEPVAQFAHYPTGLRPVRASGWVPATPANSRLGSSAAQDRRPRRGQQQQSSASNIHHQRMLFQQQQQQQQQPPANPKQALPASLPTGQQQQQQQQQPQMFQFVSSGQPRAMRTIAFDQPISFPFNFTWPGSFSLVVDAWFESPTGLQHKSLVASSLQPQLLRDTYDIYRKQLIIRHSMHGWLPVKEEWTSDVRRSDEASLSYSYRVTCEPNYYGQQCNILCRPRDDVYGHYTCSGQGSIQCLSGWQGAYCLEPICSPGCHRDQGWCSRPNECQCRSGFRGPQCRECALYPGCVHGTCQRPHECTCREGWGGLLCDEDLNVCTNHKPCLNDAVCTNVFNDQGVGSYNCTCAPGFTGTNCEFNIDELAATAAPTTVATPSSPASSTTSEPTRNLSSSATATPRLRPPTAKPMAQRKVLEVMDESFREQTGGSYLQADSWLASLCGLLLGLATVTGFVFLLNKTLPERYFCRSSRRSQAARRQERQASGGVVEDVAHLQNQQNIYKSRTSLATDKVPFAADGDSSTLTSTTSASSYRRFGNELGMSEDLTRFQLLQLEQEFQGSHYVGRARLDELVHNLKLDRHRIRRWFEARRRYESRSWEMALAESHRLGGVEPQPLYMHRSYNNLHLGGARQPLPQPPPPPPPYTISQSHPAAPSQGAYMNMNTATYTTGSLYTPHLGPHHQLYASHHHLYGGQQQQQHHQSQHQLAPGTSALATATTNSPYATQQRAQQSTATPYYVICHLLAQQQHASQQEQEQVEASAADNGKFKAPENNDDEDKSLKL